MKEVKFTPPGVGTERSSFLSCLATVLELAPAALPRPGPDEDPATGWTTSRWLGGLGLGIARVADPARFSWPGPWIARVQARVAADGRYVVMYGVPSGVVWDPAGGPAVEEAEIADGYLLAAADVALALPPPTSRPAGRGRVESIWIAAGAGQPPRRLQAVKAVAGHGLRGDRYVSARGTFPAGVPGSALTLIEAEVCATFEPPLRAHEHRRNVITRAINLNALVGHVFTIGDVRCRGMRLCEPCRVIDRYAARPVLRALVHRGGLRADILDDGVLHVGDEVLAIQPEL